MAVEVSVIVPGPCGGVDVGRGVAVDVGVGIGTDVAVGDVAVVGAAVVAVVPAVRAGVVVGGIGVEVDLELSDPLHDCRTASSATTTTTGANLFSIQTPFSISNAVGNLIAFLCGNCQLRNLGSYGRSPFAALPLHREDEPYRLAFALCQRYGDLLSVGLASLS